MAFSIFSRKGDTVKKKTENKPAPAKGAVKPPPAPAKPDDALGEDSLDFSAYVPPQKSEPPPAAGPAAPPPQPVKAKASPASSKAGPASRGPDSLQGGKAAAAPEKVVSVVEETAILFANGQVEQALAKLVESVRKTGPGTPELQEWLMLFDLYQHLGSRAEFEELALEFIVKFERSPPAWREDEVREDPATATGGIAYCALSGTLSEASAPGLEKLRSATGALKNIRIDCSKLQGLDAPGCKLFRHALYSIRDTGKEVILTGEGQLMRLLEEHCQVGKIETDGALWALLLEVYRMLDLKEKFEEAAVNYAVTFEVSPPSWESNAPRHAKRESRTSAPEPRDHALVLSGDITGAGEALAKQLRDWAAARKALEIDMSRARRVDFGTAGLMLNVFAKLQRAGIPIRISGTNELIHALFQVMGIDRVARVVPRK
jgi:ABC-type transporter Mla MlaB component